MRDILRTWENKFSEAFRLFIDKALLQRPGALLPIIPNHEQWDNFLRSVKSEWPIWQSNLVKYLEVTYPTCLVVLYGGLAFFEYNENTLWPQFAKAVGSGSLTGTQQSEINNAFLKAVQELGLKIHKHDTRTDYIGSAIYYIGIPLSLWDGFLEICEWARRRQDDWKTLSNEAWKDCVEKRASGHPRLKNFLVNNREAAGVFIHEMLKARERLLKDKTLSLEDLKQVCLLRSEYLDEVPETAEFLREDDPDSLLQDRARLVFNENRSRISLYLPGVARGKLPATWSIGPLSPKAASTSDELILNSAAFDSPLVLKLESKDQGETQALRGLKPWGLFDLERGGRLVNSDRERLPLGRYVLISSDRLDGLSRKGFEEEENPANEMVELEDGTICYLTRLCPTGKSAKLSITQNRIVRKIDFRSSLKMEAQFFIGEGIQAANFHYSEGRIKLENLPLLCVAIPFDYFKNTKLTLRTKFQIYIDDQPSCGEWKKRHEDDDREFYFWQWAKIPVPNESSPRTLSSLKQLNPDDFKPPDLKGKRIIFIKAPELGFNFEYPIEILKPKPGMEECWKNLPGDFLPWFLLCQPSAQGRCQSQSQGQSTIQGLKWDDLVLAKNAIAPNLPMFSPYLLNKYADYGLIKQQGRYWMINESRAVVETSDKGDCQMLFCGNPFVLWGLFRRMRDLTPDLQWPIIEVVDKKKDKRKDQKVDKRAEPPFLLMKWEQNQKDKLIKYLKSHDVRLVTNLWKC